MYKYQNYPGDKKAGQSGTSAQSNIASAAVNTAVALARLHVRFIVTLLTSRPMWSPIFAHGETAARLAPFGEPQKFEIDAVRD